MGEVPLYTGVPFAIVRRHCRDLSLLSGDAGAQGYLVHKKLLPPVILQ
jgi:hypothetical protein